MKPSRHQFTMLKQIVENRRCPFSAPWRLWARTKTANSILVPRLAASAMPPYFIHARGTHGETFPRG